MMERNVGNDTLNAMFTKNTANSKKKKKRKYSHKLKARTEN